MTEVCLLSVTLLSQIDVYKRQDGSLWRVVDRGSGRFCLIVRTKRERTNSTDSVVSDEPGRAGVVAEGPELERFQVVDSVWL